MNKPERSYMDKPVDVNKLDDPVVLKSAVAYLLVSDHGLDARLAQITTELHRLQQQVIELLALMKVLIETENDAKGVHERTKSN